MSAADRSRLGVICDIHAAPVTAEPYDWQNTVDLPHAVELLDAEDPRLKPWAKTP